MNIRQQLAEATTKLATVSDTPRLDAELLMAHALGVEREVLLMRLLDGETPDGFAARLARRLAHEPLAYITGTRDFWTISVCVAPGVLIPRPDSETLINAAVKHFAKAAPTKILDLGTGSGALLLAAMSEWPSARGLGIDASAQALGIASANASRLNTAAEFRLGNWGDGITETFDLILCNPPYVEMGAALSPEVMNEPHAALFAGVDGLDDYRRIIPQISALIAPGGLIAMEIGHTQAEAVSAIFAEHAMPTTVAKDLAGKDRAVLHFALGKLAQPR
jgi:release factor glutamine methyltransferase